MPDPQIDNAKANPEGDEHGHAWGSDVERVEHGYAPLMEPGNLLSREEREAAAYAEIAAIPPDPPTLLETDLQAAQRVERLRGGRPPAVTPDTKSVIVNGVAMLLPAGPDAEKVSIPAEAKAVLENAAAPLRTGQMQGLGNGLATYDLTRPADAPGQPTGTPSEAIKASAEATTPEAEAERREASAGRPAPRASKA